MGEGRETQASGLRPQASESQVAALPPTSFVMTATTSRAQQKEAAAAKITRYI